MDNNQYEVMPEETIDLREMVRYVCRKWKLILLLALVGALLGFVIVGPSTITTTHTIQQTYLISSDYNSVDLIMHKIASMTQDDAMVASICQNAGLDAEANDVRSMIAIQQDKTTTPTLSSADMQGGVHVTLTITDADEAVCQAVAQAAEKQLTQMSEEFAQEYEQFHCDKLVETSEMGSNTSFGCSKLAVIAAVAFGALSVIALAVLYLMNGTVKTVDEIRNYFGLYPIAQVTCNMKKAKGVFNKNELPVNDYAYLLDSMKAMKLENLLICGDTANRQIEEVKNWLKEQDADYNINPALAVEGQLRALEANAIVLCIQLWKTTKNELLREIEICQKLNRPIAGVIILK